jgi:hypothetical protein
MPIDDLLQITVAYEYRINRWPFNSAWRTNAVTRVRGEEHGFQFHWWMLFDPIWGAVNNAITLAQGSFPAIENINHEINTAAARTSLLNDVNRARSEARVSQLNSTQLFGVNNQNSIYRVYLDQTSAWAQTGFAVRDFNVIEVLYRIDGEYFHVGEDDIETFVGSLTRGTSNLPGIDFGGDLGTIVLIAFGIIIILLSIMALLKTKSNFVRVVAIVLILIVLGVYSWPWISSNILLVLLL